MYIFPRHCPPVMSRKLFYLLHQILETQTQEGRNRHLFFMDFKLLRSFLVTSSLNVLHVKYTTHVVGKQEKSNHCNLRTKFVTSVWQWPRATSLSISPGGSAQLGQVTKIRKKLDLKKIGKSTNHTYGLQQFDRFSIWRCNDIGHANTVNLLKDAWRKFLISNQVNLFVGGF